MPGPARSPSDTTSQTTLAHYERRWGAALPCYLPPGPVHELDPAFRVVRFAPSPDRAWWTYATLAMSSPDDEAPLELHMFSPRQTDEITVFLTVTAHYHRTGASLGLWHTVNFGRPWLSGNVLDRGFISLPYMDGPALENAPHTKCYWLIPVSLSEVDFKKQYGVEALEAALEASDFDFLDPDREPVK